MDVISLGIGDPDTPTPTLVVEALARAAADPGTHQYPSNRGRPELREALARFYDRRFGVALDPETEIVPALGAKECVFNLNLAFLDPGDVALAADPGLPGLHRRAAAGRRGGRADAAAARAGLRARPRRDRRRGPRARAADVPQLPEQPHRRDRRPTGFFERAVEFARAHDVLVVHDASYTETTFDGYVAPSFLETPGAKEVGVEVFSLSKGYNMTGWRTAAIVGNADAVEPPTGSSRPTSTRACSRRCSWPPRRRSDAGPPPEMPRSTSAGATWSARRSPRSAST